MRALTATDLRFTHSCREARGNTHPKACRDHVVDRGSVFEPATCDDLLLWMVPGLVECSVSLDSGRTSCFTSLYFHDVSKTDAPTHDRRRSLSYRLCSTPVALSSGSARRNVVSLRLYQPNDSRLAGGLVDGRRELPLGLVLSS